MKILKASKYSPLQSKIIFAQLILIVVVYFFYTLRTYLDWYSYLGIGIAAAGLAYCFVQQFKSFVSIQEIVSMNQQSHFRVSLNWKLIITTNLLFAILVGLHFLIFTELELKMDGLYREYGVGAILGGILLYFQLYKNMLKITPQGVVVGSLLNLTLFTKDEIVVQHLHDRTIIELPKVHNIRRIEIPKENVPPALRAYL